MKLADGPAELFAALDMLDRHVQRPLGQAHAVAGDPRRKLVVDIGGGSTELIIGEGFESIEIDSGPDNPWGIKRVAHSVLTEELVDDDGHPTKQALDRVLGFFDERLKHASPDEALAQ